MTTLSTIAVSCPLGTLRLYGTHDELIAVHLPVSDEAELPATVGETPILARTAAQLAEYFAGTRTEFELPLTARGTEFQRRVWQTLVEIPYAATWSYGELARAIGKPAASRAVGAANGRNPIAIIVPCHRVIGANGTLTGYGGGLPAKQWLLAHEQQHAAGNKIVTRSASR